MPKTMSLHSLEELDGIRSQFAPSNEDADGLSTKSNLVKDLDPQSFLDLWEQQYAQVAYMHGKDSPIALWYKQQADGIRARLSHK